MSKTLLLLGLIGGSIAAWIYRDSLLDYFDENTRDLRNRAQRALTELKPRVDAAMQAGQEALGSARSPA